jgi:hypothetical protein
LSHKKENLLSSVYVLINASSYLIIEFILLYLANTVIYDKRGRESSLLNGQEQEISMKLTVEGLSAEASRSGIFSVIRAI